MGNKFITNKQTNNSTYYFSRRGKPKLFGKNVQRESNIFTAIFENMGLFLVASNKAGLLLLYTFYLMALKKTKQLTFNNVTRQNSSSIKGDKLLELQWDIDRSVPRHI